MAVVAAAGIAALFWLRHPPAVPNQLEPVSRVSLTLGFRPGVVVDLGLLQAIERGDFEKNGFDITLKPYGRADLIFSAMANGEIQGSLGVPLEPLLDQASKGAYPTRGYLVWYFDSQTPYDGLVVREGGGIQSLDDLKNRSVGSHPSKQVTHFVSLFLPDSTVKPYNPAAPFTSLESGDVAAVYVLEPFLSIARASGKYRVLETNLISKRVFGSERVPAALSVLSATWIEAQPRAAADFVRLAHAAYLTDASSRDTSLVVTILTQPRFGLTPEVAKTAVEPVSSLPESLAPRQFQDFVTVLRKGGLLSGDVSLEKLLYSTPNHTD